MRSSRNQYFGRWSVLAAAVSMSLTGAAGVANAQESENDDDDGIERITVTGSRIQRDDYSAPTPVQTVTSEEMQNLGITNVAEMMTQMPSNVSNFQPENTGGSAFNVGSTIANLRGLNTFFGTRTLTLVDSRRFVPTNNGGGVDMNFIPSAMIGRMETVTGGASASYGADAVSGVVNVILDTELEGVRFEADYGTSAERDGDNYHVSVAGGTQVLDGRGHLTVSMESDSQDAIRSCADARDWCAEGYGTISNGGGFFAEPLSEYDQRDPGQPQNIITSGLRRNVSMNGTLWTNLPGEQILAVEPDGQGVREWNAGTYARDGRTETVIGGEGRRAHDGTTLIPENERNTVYTNFKYDITDDIEFYTDFSYGEVTATNFQEGSNSNVASLCVQTDNPFIPPGSELEAAINSRSPERETNPNSGVCNPGFFGTPLLTLDDGTPFPPLNPRALTVADGAVMTKDFTNQIERRVDTDTNVTRFVAGAEGSLFGGDNWNWDVYFQYGKTDRTQLAQDYQHTNRFRMAMNSVAGPGGEPICAINAPTEAGAALRADWAEFFSAATTGGEAYLDVLREGCAPLNPFGQQMSDAAREYAFGDLDTYVDIYQRLVSSSFSGEISDGIGDAGPILMATGLDARTDETINSVSDRPDPIRHDFGTQFGDAWAGRTETLEAFAEFDIPLLRDKPGVRSLALNVATRRGQVDQARTDQQVEDLIGLELRKYTQSWKASLAWDPTDWMRVRATRSSDVRAPGPRELFYSQTQPPGGSLFVSDTVQNPWLPDTDPGTDEDTEDEAQTIIGANPNLDNEVSTTETFGLVFTPGGFASGLQLSADYYTTSIKGGIQYASTNQAINLCYDEGIEFYCGLIEFGEPEIEGNPRSNILKFTTITENAQPYTTAGVDFSGNYTRQLENGGVLSMRMLATHSLEQIIVEFEGAPPENLAGQTGGLASFLPNFQPTAEWSGNMFFTYAKNAFSFTTQARYTGKGKLDISTPWYGPDDPEYDPNLTGTVSDNTLPSWTTWNMTFNYDFSASQRFAPGWAESLDAYLTVDNVTDKDPIFSRGGVGGINSIFFDTMGRTFQLGVRMQF